MSQRGQGNDPRLQRLLGGTALADLRRRLRQRFERGATGSFRLDRLTETEREALSGMLGRRLRRAASMTLDCAELDAALARAGLAASLREALEQLDGPIADKAAARTALLARWGTAVQACAEPRLAAWLAVPPAPTLLRRLARDPDTAAQLLAAAGAVLRALPAAGTPRSQLAAQTLGDAHGLDAGRPVATLVLAVLRALKREADEESGADDARDLWAAAGVLVNELARPALCLNLPAHDGPCAAGEPAYLSLRLLLRAPPPWQVEGREVHICENPNLVAIVADGLGERAAPLVCTDGMPAAAQRALLRQLAQAGARLRYHGDFDWPGLAIGNHVMRTYGAGPWRFGAADYAAAVRNAATRGRPLGASAVEAEWDGELAPVMRDCGQAVDEEAVAATLMADLGD